MCTERCRFCLLYNINIIIYTLRQRHILTTMYCFFINFCKSFNVTICTLSKTDQYMYLVNIGCEETKSLIHFWLFQVRDRLPYLTKRDKTGQHTLKQISPDTSNHSVNSDRKTDTMAFVWFIYNWCLYLSRDMLCSFASQWTTDIFDMLGAINIRNSVFI